MSFEAVVYSKLRGKSFNNDLLQSIDGVNKVGRYRNADDPEVPYPCRATFKGYLQDPETEYEKLHLHILLLEKNYESFRKAGVENIVVMYTLITDDPHFNTEIDGKDIESLAKIKDDLAITFDAT